jgi:hypothetical protein
MRSLVTASVLALALGCGPGAERDAPPGTPSTTVSLGTEVATTSSTLVPIRPLDSPDDARRLLEEGGVDPDRLSEEVGEHMRRRLH